MTVVMNESQIRAIVRTPVLLGNHVVDVKVFAVFQSLVTNRTPPLLSSDKLSTSIGWGWGSTPSLSPVLDSGVFLLSYVGSHRKRFKTGR